MARAAVQLGMTLLTVSGFCLAAPARAEDCVPPSRQASQQAVKDFLGNPSSLLNQSSGMLAASVRNLAVTSADAVVAMSKLAAGATAAQGGSIGSGLGQAALVCKKTAPRMALAIQKGVVGAGKQEVVAAYEAVVQEQVTTAVDAGAPAAGGEIASSGDSVEGGGLFPDGQTTRAVGALPLTAYFATPPVLASSSGSNTVSRIIVPSTTLITTSLPTTSGALDSVSPSR